MFQDLAAMRFLLLRRISILTSPTVNCRTHYKIREIRPLDNAWINLCKPLHG